ncbi:23237_t:CDS:2, partial [Rhizophagus irregularis]
YKIFPIQSVHYIKSITDKEKEDYLTKEIELDIDNDTSFGDSKDDDYVTEEINFDI